MARSDAVTNHFGPAIGKVSGGLIEPNFGDESGEGTIGFAPTAIDRAVFGREGRDKFIGDSHHKTSLREIKSSLDCSIPWLD
jgi:hypothetical protein